MVFNSQMMFTPRTHGDVAMTRPWVIAMVLTGTGSVLVEREVGENTNVWARYAPAYTLDSPNHVVGVEKDRRRIRITPANGASYEVSNE